MEESNSYSEQELSGSFDNLIESIYEFSSLVNTLIPLLYQRRLMAIEEQNAMGTMILEINTTYDNLQKLISRTLLELENLTNSNPGGQRIGLLVSCRISINTYMISFRQAVRSSSFSLN